MRGIKRQSAPVRAAASERIDQRPLRARRREQSVMTRRLDCITALAAVPEGEAEGVVRRDMVWRQRRRRNREWLCGRELVAGRGALRHLAFLDRDQRLSGFAVDG